MITSSNKKKVKVKESKVTKVIKRKSSNIKTKDTWDKFLKNKDSVEALKKSWNSKNPQTYYNNTITRLAKKYSNTK